LASVRLAAAQDDAPPPARTTTEKLTDAAPPAEPPSDAASALLKQVHVQPFADIVGGLKLDTIIQGPKEQRQGRVSAISVADFGLRGTAGKTISFVSELMASGGGGGDPNTLPGFELHGSSTWQGQAQLQVRRQLVRLTRGPFMVEVGRVIDEGSVDFVSAHVQDTLMQDTATAYPLLYSGILLGNGVRGTVELLPEEARAEGHSLRAGIAFFAGNPVSQTGSLQVGGSFPPFDRFYIQPYQNVKQTPDNSPDDTFHMMLVTPSLLYAGPVAEARVAFQGYTVDTNTNSTADQNIKGFNVRGTGKLKLANDVVVPFANFAFDRNDTVDPNDVSKLAVDKYSSIEAGGGIDFNYSHRTPERPNGIGLQYDNVQYQVGRGDVTTLHFVNVGTTYWINDWAAIGARLACWVVVQNAVHDEGEMSGLVTMRLVL
jgi:hypothetical protein